MNARKICSSALFAFPFTLTACANESADAPAVDVDDDPRNHGQGDRRRASTTFDDSISAYNELLMRRGREVFRHDTFGSEAFWTDALQLQAAVGGAHLGGVGPGLTPRTALELGLKVDIEALPGGTIDALAAGDVDLDDPAVTVALIELDAVIGLRGDVDEGQLTSLGITCALCHSTVDDSLTAGIGHRRDGWANRDLDVGRIVMLAPRRQVLADRLGVDVPTLDSVLASWGPGKYDAVLVLDGKAMRPDGSSGATLIPPAFGLAGMNLHTYTGFGSVPYWNAYVAITQMHGSGTFYDPRLNDPERFPLAVEHGDWNIRPETDFVTEKLAALHAYQIAIPAPHPPADVFDADAAARGKELFEGDAQCASCHVPPLMAEPGWSMHTAAEIGIDDFQAMRSPTGQYRTAKLRGLWTHMQGGFYHDGRFTTLHEVVDHYDRHFDLALTEEQKNDIVEYLKSLGDDVPFVDGGSGEPTAPE